MANKVEIGLRDAYVGEKRKQIREGKIIIQKHALRMIYSDTDSDYETALIVTRMDSLKDSREMLTARFFKKQVLASDALLHYLLPEPRDIDTICSLRNAQPFPSIRARTTKFHKYFLLYCLKHFTGAL